MEYLITIEMKKINDYYKERGILTPSEYYNRIEELLSEGKIKKYNNFIKSTPLTFIDPIFATKESEIDTEPLPTPPEDIDIVL